MNDAAPKAKRKTVAKLFALQFALLRPELIKTDVLVLAVLIEYTSGIYGYAWPSVETIAAVTGLNRRTVQRSLRRLEQAGLVTTQAGGGRNTTSRYVVRLDAFEQSPLTDLIKQAATEKASARPPFTDSEPDQKGRSGVHKGRSGVHERASARPPDPLLTNPFDSIPSSNEASAHADASPSEEDFSDDEQKHICRKLRQLDGWLKANDETARLSAETRERLAEHADRLEAIADGEAWDSRLGGWAGRIASEIRWRLSEYAA